jgi:hypothetical protein
VIAGIKHDRLKPLWPEGVNHTIKQETQAMIERRNRGQPQTIMG